ncbi:hypothetical protein [Lentibacillus sediminis]|uniref:hypothetical protein n=1 Tax=Lentibacillus sediminis TaxID=1940529 RepID=UPI0018649B0D|nr:hypothetical protein [Lentibacillus sediminis]
MAKKKGRHTPEKFFQDETGVAAVQNQLNESYQSGVIDQLDNNKGIHHYNNQKK